MQTISELLSYSPFHVKLTCISFDPGPALGFTPVCPASTSRAGGDV